MCRIEDSDNDNCGSATVELILLMPIILFIIVKVIFLFLDSMNDGIIRGEVYTTLYTYEENKDLEILRNGIETDIQQIIIGGEMPSLNIYREKYKIGLELYGQAAVGGGRYEYNSESIKYSVESGVCTSRLRRWQLYGDVLWE